MLLYADHVCAIEEFLSRHDDRSDGAALLPGALPAPLELQLVDDRLVFEPLEAGVSTSWIDRPLEPGCEAVGLCLPAIADLHLGALVDRQGDVEYFMIDGGVLLFEPTPTSTLIGDLCHRRLGRPTPPPTSSTDWYWLHQWLVTVSTLTWSQVGDRSVGPVDLVTVAGVHPAVDVEELVGLDRGGIAGFVVERHREHALAADWSCVRLDAMLDDRHVGHCWARHLDDGAFSRWMSTTGAPLSAMAEELIVGCSPFALELIGTVVADVAMRQSIA